MSLIITQINKYGIVHATDGNVTFSNGAPAGQGRKLFQLRHLNAALTVAGSFGVGSLGMNEWMERFIQEQEQARCDSLGAFARALGASLQAEMTADQKNSGSIIHIAGYVRDTEGSHPEFWHVRNVHGIDQKTGEYHDLRDAFEVGEDFWARDWKEHNLGHEFEQGVDWVYINGFASGRVSFWHLQSQMSNFFWQVWNNPVWKFRPPQSLDESALIVDLYVRTIGVLFRLSDYSAPFIGGTPQTYAIPKP